MRETTTLTPLDLAVVDAERRRALGSRVALVLLVLLTLAALAVSLW